MAPDRQTALLIGGSLLSALALAAATVSSMQLAGALVLVGAVLVLFHASRSAGLIALWVLWLVAPCIRRIFGLIDGYVSADPLALAPFVATAGVAVLELTRVSLSPRTRNVLVAALFGVAIGIPAAVAEPRAGLFGLAAYGSAVLCVVVGYREGAAADGGFTLRRVLFATAPLIAVYGVLQYFAPLTQWDQQWLDTVDIVSIGAPEEGRIRVFSTLNSPATLAVVLSVTVLFVVSSRRLSALRAILLVLTITCLALTFVRSAVVGLVGGLIGLAIATRGKAITRVVVLLVAVAVPVAALSAVSSTGDAIIERVTTLGELESDVSADARLQTTSELVPEAATTPLGHGLGSAGEAVTLREAGGLRVTDSGYLALLWQVGPVGFLLLIGAAVAAFTMLARARLHAPEHVELKAVLMSGLAMLLVVALGVDIFYGVTGAIFWYLVGKGLWLADHVRTSAHAEQTPTIDVPSRSGAAAPHPAPVGVADLRAAG